MYKRGKREKKRRDEKQMADGGGVSGEGKRFKSALFLVGASMFQVSQSTTRPQRCIQRRREESRGVAGSPVTLSRIIKIHQRWQRWWERKRRRPWGKRHHIGIYFFVDIGRRLLASENKFRGGGVRYVVVGEEQAVSSPKRRVTSLISSGSYSDMSVDRTVERTLDRQPVSSGN